LALENGDTAGDDGGSVCAPECADELCRTGDGIEERGGLGRDDNSTAGAGCMHAVCEHSEGKVGHKTYDIVNGKDPGMTLQLPSPPIRRGFRGRLRSRAERLVEGVKGETYFQESARNWTLPSTMGRSGPKTKT
jgi:hypothetical protein